MEAIKDAGRVEQVYRNRAKQSGKEYLKVLINGDTYSVWEPTLFDRFQQGKELRFEWEQKGNYKNITAVSGIVMDAPGQAAPEKLWIKDALIAQEVALKEAVNATIGLKDLLFTRDESGLHVANVATVEVTILRLQEAFAKKLLGGVVEEEPEPKEVDPEAESFADC